MARNLPPPQPFGLTQQDRLLFMQQLSTYAPTQSQNHQAPAPRGALGSNLPASVNPPGPQNTLNTLTTVTVQPKVVPQPQAPPRPGPLYRQHWLHY